MSRIQAMHNICWFRLDLLGRSNIKILKTKISEQFNPNLPGMQQCSIFNYAVPWHCQAMYIAFQSSDGINSHVAHEPSHTTAASGTSSTAYVHEGIILEWKGIQHKLGNTFLPLCPRLTVFQRLRQLLHFPCLTLSVDLQHLQLFH